MMTLQWGNRHDDTTMGLRGPKRARARDEMQTNVIQ